MLPLPRPASPRALWADLKLFWQGRTRTQWGAAILAVTIPIAIFVIFYFDARTNIQPGPRLIIVESWPATRSAADIRARQQRDSAAREARERARQRDFKQLDENLNRLGI
jgi:hypothetical protein